MTPETDLRPLPSPPEPRHGAARTVVVVLVLALVTGVGAAGIWSVHALAGLGSGRGIGAAARPGATAVATSAGRVIGAVERRLAPAAPGTEDSTGAGDTRHLAPTLRRELARATAAARADGVRLQVTSGWRSAAKQQRLFDQAVARYGSAEAARHWVLPPAESEHVKGRAVDVGPRSAARWLAAHGVRWGLCQRYANEPWHFELLAPHAGQACPALEPYA